MASAGVHAPLPGDVLPGGALPPSAAPDGASLPPAEVPAVPVMKPSGAKFTSVATISFAEDMNPRYRSTMEDAAVVIDGYGGDNGACG